MSAAPLPDVGFLLAMSFEPNEEAMVRHFLRAGSALKERVGAHSRANVLFSALYCHRFRFGN
jgi:hypothetical protein